VALHSRFFGVYVFTHFGYMQYVHVCIYYMYVNTYIYIHIYICTYMYTNTYTYI